MTIKTPTSLKSFFEKGDKPSESNFVDLIDSTYSGEIGAALVSAAGAGSTGLFKVDSASAGSFVTTGSAGLAVVSAGTQASARSAISAASDASASTTQAGLVEIATTAETVAGTDTTRAVTPAALAPSIIPPRSFIDGLTVTNNAIDAAHDLDISVGECLDSANSVSISLSSALTKRADASWAAGTNQGGLSSSLTLSADTLYYVHAIIVGGSADVGFDTSATATNLIADHSATAYREISRFTTDSSADIINDRFVQIVIGGKEHEFEVKDTTSGTAFDWTNVDGADIDEFTLSFNEVSLSGTDNLLVQIGDSGGVETIGYVSTSTNSSGSVSTNNSTSGFLLLFAVAAGVWSGNVHLERIKGTNTWISSHSGKHGTGFTVHGGGSKTLSAEIDRVRVTRTGSDTFDAGSIGLRAR